MNLKNRLLKMNVSDLTPDGLRGRAFLLRDLGVDVPDPGIDESDCNRVLMEFIRLMNKHGNTSAASVPLALDAAVRDGRIQRGEILMLEAFGGGFTWGSALIKY